MYDAVSPPSGPRMKTPSASSSAWYCQVSGTGSQRQRRSGVAAGAVLAGKGIVLIERSS